MTDDSDPESSDAALGELAGLSVTPRRGFQDRVRRRIDRRLMAGDVLDFAWTGPLLAFLELIRAPFEILSARRRKP